MKLNSKQSGISLVEIVVAMTLLAAVLTSLAGLSYQAARQANTIATTSYRQGVMMQEVNRLTALPFDALAAQAGCRTLTTGVFPHTRCITVSVTTTGILKEAAIGLIVTPSLPGMVPDTVRLRRTKPPYANPLNTT